MFNSEYVAIILSSFFRLINQTVRSKLPRVTQLIVAELGFKARI